MSDFLDRIELGGTGWETARLGLGSTFDPPAAAIERAFHEHGINYLYWGTVRQAGFAEAMRNLAAGHRDELILTVQSYSDDPGTIEGEVDEALAASGLDHFDVLLLGNRMEIPGPGYLETFERMRDRGKVKAVTLSSHNRPLLPRLLEEYSGGSSPYELLMFRYNAVHRGAEKDIFPHLPEGPRPTLATYTATRWGHLLDPAKMPEGELPLTARDCYRYALSHPAVDMVICGPGSAEQLDEALSALAAGPVSEEERDRIERIGRHIYGLYAPQYPDAGDAEDVTAGKAAT